MLDAQKEHKFWNTQPVPQLTEDIAADQNCPIDGEQDVTKVRQVSASIAGSTYLFIDFAYFRLG